MLGETVACATVSQHLYALSYICKCSATRHSGIGAPTSGVLVMEFVMSWRSINQSIFYFMSVHIEVILDKNKNI